MPGDVRTLVLTSPAPAPPPPTGVAVAPLETADRDDLARLYLASYPPGVAAADLAEARREMDATFAGEYGILRPDASGVLQRDGRPAGAVMVTERSLWDAALEGPFVIDLFLDPLARGNGLGRLLMEHAVRACALAGDQQLSLRVGEGTSAAAHGLYASLGFTPRP